MKLFTSAVSRKFTKTTRGHGKSSADAYVLVKGSNLSTPPMCWLWSRITWRHWIFFFSTYHRDLILFAEHHLPWLRHEELLAYTQVYCPAKQCAASHHFWPMHTKLSSCILPELSLAMVVHPSDLLQWFPQLVDGVPTESRRDSICSNYRHRNDIQCQDSVVKASIVRFGLGLLHVPPFFPKLNVKVHQVASITTCEPLQSRTWICQLVWHKVLFLCHPLNFISRSSREMFWLGWYN